MRPVTDLNVGDVVYSFSGFPQTGSYAEYTTTVIAN